MRIQELSTESERNFSTFVILSEVEGREGKEKFRNSLGVELLMRDTR
jgi:hypothetical protein